MALVTLDSSNFEEQTKEGVTLVDFWAEWCGPCRALTPILEELDQEIAGAATIGKVNVDDNSELAQKFNVMSIPAVFILKDGEVASQFVGVQTKQVLTDAINKELAG